MRTKRIKIAFVLTPITFGGSEQVSLNLLRNVARKRFEIVPILLLRPWEPAPYFCVELRRIGLAYFAIPVARSPNGDPLRVPRVAWSLHTILKQGDFNLVHTQGYFADICGLPVARKLGIPTIATCHGFIANDRNLRSYNFLDKYALRLCNKVITVSESIKNELISGGLKKERIKVIPNAVPTDFDPQETLRMRRARREAIKVRDDELVIGYLGRLSEEKGLRYLLEAVTILRSARFAVILLLVGDGPQKRELESLAIKGKIENSVVFAGFQTDTAKWVSAMDLFVLPSLTEGAPMALLEAMALGVPAVATAVGGVPNIIKNRENGILIPPRDTHAIVKELIRILNNPSLISDLGRSARYTVESRYNIKSWSKLVESIYLKAV